MFLRVSSCSVQLVWTAKQCSDSEFARFSTTCGVVGNGDTQTFYKSSFRQPRLQLESHRRGEFPGSPLVSADGPIDSRAAVRGPRPEAVGPHSRPLGP